MQEGNSCYCLKRAHIKEALRMFREAESFTIGVEEEFQIIDPSTYALSPDVEPIIQRARATLGEAVQYELILSQIETATPVCYTLDDVQASLTTMRHTLMQAAEA